MKTMITMDDLKNNLMVGVRQIKDDERVTHPYLDLEAFLYAKMEVGAGVVKREHLVAMNMTTEEAFKLAMENTLNDIKVLSMKETMKELTGMDLPEEDADRIILTNEDKVYGAAAILFKSVLSKAASKANADRIIILPSSIHEVIIVPDTGDYDGMNEMVQTINDETVSPEERLADHVYVYDRNTGTIEIH